MAKTVKSTVTSNATEAPTTEKKTPKPASAKKKTKTDKPAPSKPASPAKSPKPLKKPATMAELLAQTDYDLVVPQKNDILKGTITVKNKKSLIVDLGAKTEGIVADKEYDFASEFIKDLKEGDQISALVVSSENDRGQVVLSLRSAASDAKWEYFEEAADKEEILSAKGVEVNRGGLIVEVNGVRGFVPSSQFGREFVGKINQLVGETIEVKAIEVDREKNRLIFSERHVSEAKELSQKDEALKQVVDGEVYEGVVSGVMHFGLFVTVEVPVDEEQDTKGKSKNIGYVEGLVHISEISWEKVNHPRDYHNVGDRLQIKVLGVDERTNKLNLSIKQLQDDPWITIGEKYSVGTTFTGKVTRLEPFGAFVNVEPGVDGLIHSSKLDPNKELHPGDEVTVNVENVVPEQRRMSLSVVLTEAPMGYK
jgi:small subunit ribosomal protein S1